MQRTRHKKIRWLWLLLLMVVMFPKSAIAQVFPRDIPTIEAYIYDHKQQRSLLLTRSTLETSNALLHKASKVTNREYKDINVELDKYTRAFDVIDVMYQSLHVKNTYKSVSERIGDYKRLLDDFNKKVVKRKHIALADTMLLSINARAIKQIAADGDQLYKSVNDLALYASGAAACSTSDLLMVLEAVNNSLDNIERHLNSAYFETWRYVQVRMGYWKEQVYRTQTKAEIIDGAFGRWRRAGKLDKKLK